MSNIQEYKERRNGCLIMVYLKKQHLYPTPGKDRMFCLIGCGGVNYMGGWIWLALSLYTGVFCAEHLKRNDTIEVYHKRKNDFRNQPTPYYGSYVMIAYIADVYVMCLIFAAC